MSSNSTIVDRSHESFIVLQDRIFDLSLSTDSFRVYVHFIYLASTAQKEGLEDIAKRCNITQKKVDRAIADLVEHKLIEFDGETFSLLALEEK